MNDIITIAFALGIGYEAVEDTDSADYVLDALRALKRMIEVDDDDEVYSVDDSENQDLESQVQNISGEKLFD